MARKRPRAAAAQSSSSAVVSFAPAKGRRGAAATELIGKLDAKAEAAASAAEKDARRALLLEKLKTIEEKRLALAASSASGPATTDAPVTSNAANTTRTTRRRNPRAASPTLPSSSSSRKRTAEVLVDHDDSSPAAAGEAKAKSKAGVKSSKKARKSTPETSNNNQPLASRRTSRSRVPSVKISTLPGEDMSGVGPRCVGISRCPSIAFVRKLLTGLLRDPSARPFAAPVTQLWSPEDIPGYSKIVKTPMDLATIKKRLEASHYLRKPSACSEFTGDKAGATSPLSSASFPLTPLSAFPPLATSLGAGQSVNSDNSPSDSAECLGVGVGEGDCGDVGVTRPSKITEAVAVTDRPTRDSGFIFDLNAFCSDARLCFQNCMLYCPSHEPLHACARALLDQFDRDIADCPVPAPIFPESRIKKDRSSGKLSLAEFANGAAVSSLTEATSSALSSAQHHDNEGGRGSSGSRQVKKPRRGRGKPSATDDSGSRKTVSAGASASHSPSAVPRQQQPKPENPRQLKRRLEYLSRCRVHAVARENGVDDVPMTHAEKARLTNRLSHIPVDRVAQLVRIVSNASGRDRVGENEEIEIDLDRLDPCALREIERFVDGCVSRNVGGPPIPREKGGPGSEFETVAAVEAEMKVVSVALQTAKSRPANSSSGGGLWDASSSDSSDNSDDESLSGSDSDSSDDEE